MEKSTIKEATEIFRKKAESFYPDDERKKGIVFSFQRDGDQVDVGLMSFVSVTVNKKVEISEDNLIPYLQNLCTQAELSSL